jgi:opacity protein-like surface antigen
MITAGAGATWAGWRRLVIDLQYRFGHIMAESSGNNVSASEGININRAGIGVGVRF